MPFCAGLVFTMEMYAQYCFFLFLFNSPLMYNAKGVHEGLCAAASEGEGMVICCSSTGGDVS